jgi:hypothetical protein
LIFFFFFTKKNPYLQNSRFLLEKGTAHTVHQQERPWSPKLDFLFTKTKEKATEYPINITRPGPEQNSDVMLDEGMVIMVSLFLKENNHLSK